MVGNTENIFVDFDYNNIIIVDPNKVVDEKGTIKERYVKQENLVMYANLECQVFPRTKLALGVAINDSIQTISIASMNFMSPGGTEYLNNAYTDEITGKGTLKGKGVNQPNKTTITNPKDPNDTYIRQNMMSNGKEATTDNGLLGITSINIRQGLDFMPTFDITLQDVKGRALFEAGNSSPYAAFFNMPYPMFELTLKGFYGKGVKYKLMLRSFNARYDYNSGNFNVDLKFHTYQFSAIAEVSMGYLLSTPYMYKSSLSVTPKLGGPSSVTKINNENTYKGFEKVKEVYNEYKSKGLIPENFPYLTVGQLRYNIEYFVKNVLDTFTKQNLDPLTNIEMYQRDITQLRKDVYMAQTTSWVETNLDLKNYIVLKESGLGSVKSLVNQSTEVINSLASKTGGGGNTTQTPIKYIYTFKKELKDPSQRSEARSKLEGIIKEAVKKLNDNPTLGANGSYTIDNKKTSSSIAVKLSYDMFVQPIFTKEDVDLKKTYMLFKNTKKEPTDAELVEFEMDLVKKGVLKNEVNSTYTLKDGEAVPVTEYFFYEGKKSFTEELDNIDNQSKKLRKQIETELSDALFKLLQSSDSGIGFKPTIRNVLAVIFANGEAFLRMLEEVHKKAWEVRGDADRKKAVFNSSVSNANPDNTTPGLSEDVPVYPWPTFLIQTNGEDGHEKFEPRYPGDRDVITLTKGYDYSVWPEVEFVEEFSNAYTSRGKGETSAGPTMNSVTDVKRITLNAIEFPISNNVFENKEEVKFFYEIFERIMSISGMSRLGRLNHNVSSKDIIANLISESETINIKESLSNDNPFLIKKLSDYAYSSNNFLNVLRHISNQGVGLSWQNYIRAIYNTVYIKNQIQFSFIDEVVLGLSMSKPLVSLENEPKFNELLTQTTITNNVDFLDVYPFIDITWIKDKLPGGKNVSQVSEVFNSTNTISYDKNLKVLTNFTLKPKLMPVTNFVYGDFSIPRPESFSQLKEFYTPRIKPDKQLITEGNLEYINYSGYVSNKQTISMLNTPYFVNAIQEGVKHFREYNQYPFISAAYLFINSLPLTTFSEKFKTNELNTVTDLDYVFGTLKKFGAIHKLPYPWILKVGSIWHRYKKYINNGVDILDGVWKNFDYKGNFDPTASAATKNYTLTIDGGVVDIILEKNATFGDETSTVINTGFYPKVINDFNLFYQGFEVFSGYTNTEIQQGIDTFNVGVKFVDETLISGIKGFDKKSPKRDLKVIPWSVFVGGLDGKSTYPLPSMGSVVNQAKNECFKGPEMKIELYQNQSMFNGTVRSFWALPTYGYYDNSRVFKHSPKQYLKELLVVDENKQSQNIKQPNYSILGDTNRYHDISEIFSVFEKDILDLFETKFLDFSKSMYDINDSVDYGLNFQKLMVDMMRIPKQTGVTSTEIVNKIMTQQLDSVNQAITKFLETTQYIQYGNPGNYDRKLFLTFSNYELTDPYVWEKYEVTTKNALPTNGGTVTLSTSKTAYPNEWKTLETYIGFSDVPYLEYGNDGSYITDFFVDLNIAFTEENIKRFSPMIKIYATQKLRDYLDSAVIPSNAPNRNSYAVLTDGNIIELIPGVEGKVAPVLYTPNKTLITSGALRKLTGKNPEDKMFNRMIVDYYGEFGLEDNPIVTKYIRPKNLMNKVPYKSNFNFENFKKLVDEYINELSGFQDRTLNNLMLRLQVILPSVTTTPEEITTSNLESTLGKLEYWESFKSLNDKWIAGYEFSNKTLFEDVLMLDRASRNIGDDILVDIYKLKSRLDTLFNDSPLVDMLSFAESILIENNFVVMNLPSYVNFYNITEVSKNAKPKLESTSEFANTLFGTFLNVDTRQSSAKMVCTYAGNSSQHLDIKNIDYKFRDDAFDIRKSDNPLVENQIDKNDYDKSNRVVGFNVDIGTQNQSIFYNFSVGQETGTATAESLEVENMMANMSSGKNSATQSISLYNIYKNRSYTCSLTMMGNALIQPTMYFNLRYVPMFHGPYMITTVNHSISPGNFETVVEGIRQPTASILKIDNYIQTLKVNLLTTIIDKQKVELENAKKLETTNTTNKEKADETKKNITENKDVDETNSCSKLLKDKFKKYEPIDTPVKTTVSPKDLVTKILTRMSNKFVKDDGKLKYAIFYIFYINGYASSKFSSFENNYAQVSLDNEWTNISKNKYFCMSALKNVSIPYATFGSISDHIDFLIDRNKSRMENVKTDNFPSELAKFYLQNEYPNVPKEVYDNSDKPFYTAKADESIKLFDKTKKGVNI